MTQQQAKRDACFLAALWIRSAMGEGAHLRYLETGELADTPNDRDALRLEAALDQLLLELERRGTK